MNPSPGLGSILSQYGLRAVLDRHVVRAPGFSRLPGICQACGADVDVGPYLRDSEIATAAALNSPDETTAILAWSRLLDDEPWLCEVCWLLLP